MGALRRSIQMLCILFLVVVISFGIRSIGESAGDVYVDDDTCPLPGSGTQADPYCSLYDTIGSATAGDTIHVASGAYDEGVGYVISKDLNIIGEGSPYVTILSQPASTLFRVETGNLVSISGVTITSAGDSGIINLGTAQLEDVIISGNDGDTAGGGINNSGTMTISNSTITNNETISSGAHGGGILNTGALTLLDSEVSLNSAPASGSLGGGIYSSGDLVVERTLIHNNNSHFRGGGIYSSGSLELINVGLFYNHATDSSMSFGGGLSNSGLATLRSVTINGNSAQSAGGGIWNENTKAYLINTTISGNSAPYGGVWPTRDQVLGRSSRSTAQQSSTI